MQDLPSRPSPNTPACHVRRFARPNLGASLVAIVVEFVVIVVVAVAVVVEEVIAVVLREIVVLGKFR